MGGEDRTKHRRRRGRQHNIAVRGEQRKDIDKDLLVQAVLATGRQLAKEGRFFDWLMAQDERIAAGTLVRLGYRVIMIDSVTFAFFDGGYLVFCLSDDAVKEALKVSGAKLFTLEGGEVIFERLVMLPETADLGTWEQYALAAMRYAIECIEENEKAGVSPP